MENENNIIQEKALAKYGSNFDENFYFETIALDKEFLKMFNKMIDKYLNKQLKVIIKHREKDILTNKWILKQLYLQI